MESEEPMSRGGRYTLRDSLSDRFDAIREGIRVPLFYEKERVFKVLGVAAGLAFAVTNPVAVAAAAAGALGYVLWTRRELVGAMVRLNRLVLPELEHESWSPAWAEQVAQERLRFELAFEPVRKQMRSTIVHFGSTSVPNIEVAKPIHDLAVLSDEETPSPAMLKCLADLDYFVIGSCHHALQGGDTWAFWFPRDAEERQRFGAGFSLHLMGPSGRNRMTEMLVHARFLQSHPAEAKAYSDAKRWAKASQTTDVANYRVYAEKKNAFLKEQTVRAREWQEAEGIKIDIERDYPFGSGTNAASHVAMPPISTAK